MELLGSRNWWFPAWLDRIVPTLNVEGHEVESFHADLEGAEPEPAREPVDA
jgi:RND superfamily putative drug exporter